MAEEQVQPTEAVVYTEPSEDTGPEIYTEPLEPIPDESRRVNDALDAAMQGSSVGQDPRAIYESMQQSLDYDADDRSSVIVNNMANTVSQEEDRIRSTVSSGGTIVPSLEASTFEQIEVASQKTMAEARTYMMSLPSFKTLSPDQQEDAVWLQTLKGLSHKVNDETGMGQAALDLGGAIAIPQENFRVQEIAEVLGVDFSAGDLFDTTDFYSSLVRQLLVEEPEQRMKMVNTLISAWPEIHGNNRMALAQVLNDFSGDFSTDWKHVENYIERADQSMLTLGLGKILKGGLKAASYLRIAAKTNNAEGMADAVEAAMKGELASAGVTPMEGATSVTPMADMQTLFKGSDNSLTEEVVAIQVQNKQFLDQIDEVDNFGLHLSDAQKVSAMDRAVKDFKDVPGISGIKANPVNESTYKMTYKVEGEDVEQVRHFTRNDVGGFNSDGRKGYTNFDWGVTSPIFRFGADKLKLVQLPEQMKMQGDKIRALYDSAIKSSVKGLNKNEMKNLDLALIKGDEFMDESGELVGKEFTRSDIVDGEISGLRLSEKEYAAYKGIRQVVDHMYWSKNKEIIDTWNSKGIKTTNWNGLTIPVKTYAAPKDAMAGYAQAETRSKQVIIDGEEGRRILGEGELDAALFNDMYAKGYDLTKVDKKGLLAHNNDNYEWAFIKRSALDAPSGMVLGRREGYMPKIRKDAHYFIKENYGVTVGGKSLSAQRTVRYFDNNTDAQKYLDELDPQRNTYEVVPDRELSATALNDEYINIGGGLITGARKKTEIPFGFTDEAGKREDSLGALQRYVNNISHNMPLSVYRIGLQEQWLNHARQLGAIAPNFRGGFEKAIAEVPINHQSFKFLEDSHGQVSFISGIPTTAEKQAMGRWKSFARQLEKIPKIGKPLSRRVLNTSIDGMSGTARGLTFHMMLGMYNPAQFAIQASGSLVALSINPVHGAKAIGQMTQAGMLDLAVGSPAKLKAFKANLSKKGLLDEEAYNAWDKSGLRESVTHSNLDYHSLWNDAPYDAGVLRRVMGNGDLFFKHGELVNSRISFFTAFNRWKEINKGKKVDSAAMEQILARTEQYRLNMSRVNSAKFQRGLTSVPTQFQQVNTKFFEKLVGSDFTAAEKGRLLAAQGTVFGAAGVPLFSTLTPHVLEMAGVDVENTSAESLQKMYSGVAGWAIQDYFDVNSVITGRMTLGQDFIENALGAITEPVVMWDVALGPFKEVFARSNTAIERMYTTFSTMAYGDDMTAEDFSAVGKILVRSLSGIPSSSANLVKAWDMTHSKFYKNKRGKSVFEWSENNIQTIIAQSLGFAPQEVADWYELNNRDGGMIPGSVKNGDADRIAWLLGEMGNQSDESQSRWHGAAINAILSKYERPQDRKVIMDKLNRALDEPENAKYKQLIKILTNFRSEVQDGWAEIHGHSKILSSPAVAKELEKRGVK